MFRNSPYLFNAEDEEYPDIKACHRMEAKEGIQGRDPILEQPIFWLIGFPVYFGSLVALTLLVPFVLNVLYWRFLEEKELINRFPEYSVYMKKTLF